MIFGPLPQRYQREMEKEIPFSTFSAIEERLENKKVGTVACMASLKKKQSQNIFHYSLIEFVTSDMVQTADCCEITATFQSLHVLSLCY